MFIGTVLSCKPNPDGEGYIAEVSIPLGLTSAQLPIRGAEFKLIGPEGRLIWMKSCDVTPETGSNFYSLNEVHIGVINDLMPGSSEIDSDPELIQSLMTEGVTTVYQATLLCSYRGIRALRGSTILRKLHGAGAVINSDKAWGKNGAEIGLIMPVWPDTSLSEYFDGHRLYAIPTVISDLLGHEIELIPAESSFYLPKPKIAKRSEQVTSLTGCPILHPDLSIGGIEVLAALPQRTEYVMKMISSLEKSGQGMLVSAGGAVLPVLGSSRTDLAEAGFKFSDTYEDNPLFRRAVPPPGWTLKRDPEHEYWSALCDSDGQARFWVYYKATPGSARAEIRKTKT